MSLTNLSDNQLLEYYQLYQEMDRYSKRNETIKLRGWDPKFLYHVVRLLDEAEQILSTGDIDLQRNKEQLKAIRRGEMSQDEVERWAAAKERALEDLYHTSTLQYSPDEEAIKKLLLECLEEHYGSLEKVFTKTDRLERALLEISDIVDRTRTDA